MKFVCDRCRTRYSIADEKVRGKVLKVRCKTCSNIIVVRESTAALQLAAAGEASAAVAGANPPQPQASVAPAAPPSVVTGIAWWVAIKGQQQGPLSAHSVEKLFHDGQITAKSYVWNESLPAWQRLREVPEFTHLFGEAVAQPPLPPPPVEESAGAQVLNLEAARAQRQQGTPASAAAFDPFAAAAAASSVPGGADQAPRESTRVFIMNAGLANRAAKHRTYAVAALLIFSSVIGAGYADWAGYIQIPGLHNAISLAAATAGVARPPSRQTHTSWDDAKGDDSTRCELMGMNCPEQRPKAVRRTPRPKSGGGVADLDLDGAFGGPGNADSQIARANGQAADINMPDSLGSNQGNANDIASLFSNDKKRRFQPKAKIEAPSVSAGSGLDSEQIFKVVRDNQEAIKNCMETAAKQGSPVNGKQYLVLTISPRGTVPTARFKKAVVSASPIGECITKRAKKWKFPAFSGPAFDVEIPLVLATSM